MHTVTSRDGTTIAHDRLGEGSAVILIGGALSRRSYKGMRQLAELLAAQGHTVINYDRRGRGDSGDTKPYAVEREIEDLAVLIEAAGGSAALWGWSSGAVLALRAAAAGLPVEKVSTYEPPFMVDPDNHLPETGYRERMDELVAAGRRADAVKHFMRSIVDVPAPFVAVMRLMPMWKDLKAVAHTLPYDLAIMGDTMAGHSLAPDEWAGVTAPVLVVYGEKSPPSLQKGSRQLAEVLPDATLRGLPKQNHNVSMKELAPVLGEFLRAPSAVVPLDRPGGQHVAA
jgi:pimeloyl-ACP methyl ester carboxylesterase